MVTGTSRSLSPTWPTHSGVTKSTVTYLRLHGYQSFRGAAHGAQGICCSALHLDSHAECHEGAKDHRKPPMCTRLSIIQSSPGCSDTGAPSYSGLMPFKQQHSWSSWAGLPMQLTHRQSTWACQLDRVTAFEFCEFAFISYHYMLQVHKVPALHKSLLSLCIAACRRITGMNGHSQHTSQHQMPPLTFSAASRMSDTTLYRLTRVLGEAGKGDIPAREATQYNQHFETN